MSIYQYRYVLTTQTDTRQAQHIFNHCLYTGVRLFLMGSGEKPCRIEIRFIPRRSDSVQISTRHARSGDEITCTHRVLTLLKRLFCIHRLPGLELKPFRVELGTTLHVVKLTRCSQCRLLDRDLQNE
jgi:hypothetical protein